MQITNDLGFIFVGNTQCIPDTQSRYHTRLCGETGPPFRCKQYFLQERCGSSFLCLHHAN